MLHVLNCCSYYSIDKRAHDIRLLEKTDPVLVFKSCFSISTVSHDYGYPYYTKKNKPTPFYLSRSVQLAFNFNFV